MLKSVDNVRLPHHLDIGNLIHDSKISVKDIAKNIVSDKYPNGVPADYLQFLIKDGLNDNDAKVVYNVTQELCKQQSRRNSRKRAENNQYIRDVDAKLKRKCNQSGTTGTIGKRY